MISIVLRNPTNEALQDLVIIPGALVPSSDEELIA
jgi:hypothetical protein